MLSAQDGNAGAIQPRLPGRDRDPRAAAQAKRDSSRLNRQAVLRSVGVATRCDGHSPAAEIHLRSPCKRDGATAQLARLSPDRRRLLPRRARSGFCRPNGEPHLMVARGTPIDPNSCVASLRKPFDARDFHHFTAAARRPFSRARHQQTLKYRHCRSSAKMLGPPGSLLEGYFVRHSC